MKKMAVVEMKREAAAGVRVCCSSTNTSARGGMVDGSKDQEPRWKIKSKSDVTTRECTVDRPKFYRLLVMIAQFPSVIVVHSPAHHRDCFVRSTFK